MSKPPASFIVSRRPAHEGISFLVTLNVPFVTLYPPRLYFTGIFKYFKRYSKLLTCTIIKDTLNYNRMMSTVSVVCTVHLKCDGTWWRTGWEVKGKLSNGVGSQYSSHYLGTWYIQRYYRWCAHLGCASIRLNWRPPADLNGLVHFAERRNQVSARVPSHFVRSLLTKL